MKELHGKGWCVLGYFLWMLGAGVFLDARGGPAAWLLCCTGAALFGVGWLQLRAGAATRHAEPDVPDLPLPGRESVHGRTP